MLILNYFKISSRLFFLCSLIGSTIVICQNVKAQARKEDSTLVTYIERMTCTTKRYGSFVAQCKIGEVTGRSCDEAKRKYKKQFPDKVAYLNLLSATCIECVTDKREFSVANPQGTCTVVKP
jgi:hypothetical protein